MRDRWAVTLRRRQDKYVPTNWIFGLFRSSLVQTLTELWVSVQDQLKCIINNAIDRFPSLSRASTGPSPPPFLRTKPHIVTNSLSPRQTHRGDCHFNKQNVLKSSLASCLLIKLPRILRTLHDRKIKKWQNTNYQLTNHSTIYQVNSNLLRNTENSLLTNNKKAHVS